MIVRQPRTWLAVSVPWDRLPVLCVYHEKERDPPQSVTASGHREEVVRNLYLSLGEGVVARRRLPRAMGLA